VILNTCQTEESNGRLRYVALPVYAVYTVYAILAACGSTRVTSAFRDIMFEFVRNIRARH